MRRNLALLVLVALLVILGLWALSRSGSPETVPPSVTLSPEPALEEVLVRLSGEIKPDSGHFIRVFASEHVDPLHLAEALESARSPDGVVEVHQPSGSVIVVDTREVVLQMDLIAETVDVGPE